MNCDQCNAKAFVHSSRIRNIRDIEYGQPCIHEVKTTKFICSQCNHMFTSPSYPKSGMTEDYKYRLIQECLNRTYSDISKRFQLSDVTIRKIFKSWIDDEYVNKDIPAFIGIYITDKGMIIYSGTEYYIIDVCDDISEFLDDNSYISKIFLSSSIDNFYQIGKLIQTEKHRKISFCIDRHTYVLFLQSVLVKKLSRIESNAFHIDDFFIENYYLKDIWPDSIQNIYNLWWNNEYEKIPIFKHIHVLYSPYLSEEKAVISLSWQICLSVEKITMLNIEQYNGLHFRYRILSMQ